MVCTAAVLSALPVTTLRLLVVEDHAAYRAGCAGKYWSTCPVRHVVDGAPGLSAPAVAIFSLSTLNDRPQHLGRLGQRPGRPCRRRTLKHLDDLAGRGARLA